MRDAMSGTAEIRLAGKTVIVPSADVCGWTVVTTGGWLRMAALKDEELVEGEGILEPTGFLEQLRNAPVRSDIFSFAQRPPDTTPRHRYHFEWDNWAAIRMTSFEDWWRRLRQESRKNGR